MFGSGSFNKAAELLDNCGVELCILEGTDDDSSAASMRYLNQGDTYALTLVLTDDYVNGIELIATSWGDWYEEAERDYCYRYCRVRCGYCSALTAVAEEWDDTICENCGHNVSG